MKKWRVVWDHRWCRFCRLCLLASVCSKGRRKSYPRPIWVSATPRLKCGCWTKSWWEWKGTRVRAREIRSATRESVPIYFAAVPRGICMRKSPPRCSRPRLSTNVSRPFTVAGATSCNVRIDRFVATDSDTKIFYHFYFGSHDLICFNAKFIWIPNSEVLHTIQPAPG